MATVAKKRTTKTKVKTPERPDPAVQLGRDCRRLVEIKAQLDELEKEKKELDKYVKKVITTRNAAVMVNDPDLEGVVYSVKIMEITTSRLDTALVRRILDEEQISLCSKESTSERMSIESMTMEYTPVL